MNFISLFSGIGGLDLGLERAGMNCVAQAKNDPWCNRILEKHWPDVPRWDDIKTLNPKELPDADLICGGFPCQPVSLAGARLAQQDDRWLWPEYFRIVRAPRPRFVLVENVPGLASAGMGDILGDLAQIGYDTEWQSIPAAAFGAPHLRWRLFLVAYTNGARRRTSEESWIERQGSTIFGNDGEPRLVADASGIRQPSGSPRPKSREPHTRTETDAVTGCSWWQVEPDVGRVAHGIPSRVDRLRGLGNAVVPQVAEYVGRMILEATA